MACARIKPFCLQYPIVFIETLHALAMSLGLSNVANRY